jgi:hypothetical protein
MDGTSDPPSGTIRKGHIQLPTPVPGTQPVFEVGKATAHAANSTVQLFRYHHHVHKRCGPIPRSQLHHKMAYIRNPTYTYPRRNCRRRGSGANSAHAAQILPFHLFRHHHHVVDWHSDPHHWYHKTRLSHPNYPIPVPVDKPVMADSAIASSNSTVPLFRHHHHVLRWDWHFRSTLWYHKTRLSHPNYPHLSQGRNQCRTRGSATCTCSSNSTVPIVPPPPPCCGGLALDPLVPS